MLFLYIFVTVHIRLNIAIGWLPLLYFVWSAPGSKVGISVPVYHGYPSHPTLSWDSRTYFEV